MESFDLSLFWRFPLSVGGERDREGEVEGHPSRSPALAGADRPGPDLVDAGTGEKGVGEAGGAGGGEPELVELADAVED